jgi:transcriptional regulator with XRE-family HTH domain
LITIDLSFFYPKKNRTSNYKLKNKEIKFDMENINQKSLGTRVRALRKIARLSQEEVAKRIDISFHHFKVFEEGLKNLDEEAIIKLSQIFSEDLLKLDSEIVLCSKDNQLTKIIVKRENKHFIYEFLQNFIKLDSSLKNSLLQIISKL